MGPDSWWCAVAIGICWWIMASKYDVSVLYGEFWLRSASICLDHSVTCLDKDIRVFVQFKVLHEIYLLIWNIWNIFKRIILVKCGSAFLSCVSWVYNVDICFFRMRDRSRMEAVGKSTIDVSCEEVNVVEFQELKWIFFGYLSLWRGIESVSWRKRNEEERSLTIVT